MSYVTLEEFKLHIRNELGGVDDVELQEALDSADEAINDYCGRTFTVASSGTRVFVPSGSPVLYIDDCTTVTSVTVDGAVLGASSYQKEPLNGRSFSGQTVPYTRLVHLSDYWSVITEGEATISIVATRGWAATPSRVTSAARILAKEIAETRNQLGGYQVIAPEVAARAVSHPKYRQMLDPLRRMDRVSGLA